MKHNGPNKIIFLDIDGVLSTGKKESERWYVLELSYKDSGKIVMNSSWRKNSLTDMVEELISSRCYEEIKSSKFEVNHRWHYFTLEGYSLPIVIGRDIKHYISMI